MNVAQVYFKSNIRAHSTFRSGNYSIYYVLVHELHINLSRIDLNLAMASFTLFNLSSILKITTLSKKLFCADCSFPARDYNWLTDAETKVWCVWRGGVHQWKRYTNFFLLEFFLQESLGSERLENKNKLGSDSHPSRPKNFFGKGLLSFKPAQYFSHQF